MKPGIELQLDERPINSPGIGFIAAGDNKAGTFKTKFVLQFRVKKDNGNNDEWEDVPCNLL